MSFDKFIYNRRFSYKILKPHELQLFYKNSIFIGTEFDKKHGYIHLSNGLTQTKNIIEKFYQFDSVEVLQISNDKLAGLKFKKNKIDGDIYPYLYSYLSINDIVDVRSIPYDKNNLETRYNNLYKFEVL